MCRILVAHGADPQLQTSKEYCPIAAALNCENQDLVDYFTGELGLIPGEAAVSAAAGQPCQWKWLRQTIRAQPRLVKKGALIAKLCEDGISPGKTIAMIRWLRKKGASITATDENGRTPFLLVSKHYWVNPEASLRVLKVLLRLAGKSSSKKRSLLLTKPNKYKMTPLWIMVNGTRGQIVDARWFEAYLRLGSCHDSAALNQVDKHGKGLASLIVDSHEIREKGERRSCIAMLKILWTISARRDPDNFIHKSCHGRGTGGKLKPSEFVPSEDEAADIRYRVYFGESLVVRLLGL
jgi:hypothetical protein